MADRRLKIRALAETVGILKDRMDPIADEILDIRKLLALLVSRLLTPDSKRKKNKQSKQCISLGEPAPEKVKNLLSSGKSMVTVFCDS